MTIKNTQKKKGNLTIFTFWQTKRYISPDFKIYTESLNKNSWGWAEAKKEEVKSLKCG